MTVGKKNKRDDISAVDSFDEVVIGLHQAESAVLMLKSPEDDVKTRTCEALYKFANKSDDNKKALISLNTLNYLQPLIRDENKVVKRNAVLVYGILSSLPSARSIIRSLPNIVTDLLRLLDPEEFETTREFAAMTLSHLCSEYAGIYDLIEHKCFPVIIPCLKSPDPDVQKNSLDIINMLLQDFEARPMLKAAEGLETLIELLVSEYPVIQDLVLKIFARATQDSYIRTALRDMNALDVFVDIIGVPEFNDIHVSALHVIANLLDDIECVKHLVSQGSLQKLLHFITDRQVYNENDIKVNSTNQQQNKDKNAKARKPSPKKGDKKKSSKGEVDGKKDEEKPPSNTLPEAKIHTCNTIMRAGCKEETRKILHDADVERMLVSLLSHEDEGVRAASAQAIATLAESAVCQDRIAELGGPELLIRMTRSDHRELKSAGATALAALTTGNGSICREVASRNSGLEALLSCLHISDPEVDLITVGGLMALTNLAVEETTRPKVLHAITAKLFIPTLNSSSLLTQSKASLAVASLISEPHTIQQFIQLGGLSSLLNLIQSTNNDVRRAACWAIASLSADHTVAVTISQLNLWLLLPDLHISAASNCPRVNLMELLVYDVHPHIALLREICGETNEEFVFDDSDDESYLKSLDPKNWKDQDHYSVLGLGKKRFLASPDDIRKAYRRKILDHHPDKRRSRGECVQDEKLDYFSCITIAYEILGNPTKRLAYDSVDPVVVDDSVPSISEIKSNFFTSLGNFFHRKSRWSKKQPTPYLGNNHTDIEEVLKFYDFWEEYDTCRDYSYLDEEDKEKGEDRETRRAIERQNRNERARRRNEEVRNVRNIVLLAKENDPRILAANKAARDAKEAKRQARLMAAQKRRELEEEQKKREAEATALARAASEERRRLEAERVRKERELSRNEAKRERRQLRSILVERFNYFLVDKETDTSESGSHQVKILADMDLLCQRLSNAQLHELNEHLEQADTSNQAHCIFSSKVESVKRELQVNNIQSQTKLKSEENSPTERQTSASKWTAEMIQVLVKAVNILPAGTPKRWEAIAVYVNQHIDGTAVSSKDVLRQAKLLKEEDSNLRKTANTKAFDSFSNSVKETNAIKNVTITTQLEAEGSRPWTVVEQRALEQALKTYPSNTGDSGSDDRWQLIANVVGTRTRRECIIRCKELAEQVRAKKAALSAVKKS
ncbi:unnamed protein product [Schistosoma turkestanicum]|nr:unnamed protein product [Schistosoma turkestanicum]